MVQPFFHKVKGGDASQVRKKVAEYGDLADACQGSQYYGNVGRPCKARENRRMHTTNFQDGSQNGGGDDVDDEFYQCTLDRMMAAGEGRIQIFLLF